ncbi:MAG: ribonuclease III [Saprospiraceae bacterium]|nr:ribonuclease III [Saprospiraceae bacterium]MBK9630476.1 ribonuclease III [Saprospiraceae bacterium]
MLGFFFRIVRRTNYKYFSKDKFFTERLREIVGFTPSNLYLFKLAFFHKSTLNNLNGSKAIVYQSNERLEYLGDALLSFVVGEYLFNTYPKADEGFLTKMRSKIVKRKTLNELAMKMGLDGMMSEFNHTNISSSMLGNALEALIGAIYLEKGFDYVRHFVLKKILKKYIDIAQLEAYDDNFKSQLLEYCQKHNKEIDFRIISKSKNDKRDRFKVGVFIDGVEIASAEDFNKKSAEQIASEIALSTLPI